MKKISLVGLMGVIVLLSAFTINNSINWEITDGYSIQFKGADVEGIFKKMSGDITFSEKDLANSNFSISIDAASINTGNGMKNRHAVSDKWFDAKNYPNINFNSSKFLKTSSGYQVEGTLDLHGIKKQVTIPFTFSSNTFIGSFKVNRLDYSVGTMKGMSKKVGNEIEVQISVPVTSK